MILTTGVSIGSDAAAQKRFVRDLEAEGAVGIAVELGFAWHRELPEPLIREADRRGIPLVALRRGMRFVEVSEAVNGSLLDTGHALARRGEELHHNLDAIVLEGEGAEVVLAEVSRRIGNPVVLEAAIVDAWSALKWPEGMSGDAEGAIALPVTVRGRIWGRVVALQVEGEFDRFTSIAMERAAVAVGLGLMRGGEEDELRARTRGNLLFEVAAGLVDPLSAARRASTLGFPRRHGELVVIAAIWRPEAETERDWSELLAPLRAAMAEPDRPALLGSRGPAMFGLLDRGTKGSEPDELAARRRIAGRFHSALERHGVDPGQAALAISGSLETWDQLGEALVGARLAAEAGAVGPKRQWHDASRTEVGQLLLSLRGLPELSAFAEERLGPLLEIGGERGRDLLETLEAYLHCGGRKTEAARELGIERQSLYHRLDRIESILAVDLSDGDTVLALHLAVMIRRLLSR